MKVEEHKSLMGRFRFNAFATGFRNQAIHSIHHERKEASGNVIVGPRVRVRFKRFEELSNAQNKMLTGLRCSW